MEPKQPPGSKEPNVFMRRLSTARPFRQGAELHQRRPRCLSLDAAPGAWWQYESTSQLQMQVRTPKHARDEVNSFCSLSTWPFLSQPTAMFRLDDEKQKPGTPWPLGSCASDIL